MMVPGQNHRDPWFAPFYKACIEDVKWMYQATKGTAIIYPGTGTGGWESCLTNTLSPGDKASLSCKNALNFSKSHCNQISYIRRLQWCLSLPS